MPRNRDDDARLTRLLAEVNRARIGVRLQRAVVANSTNRHVLAQRYGDLADALEAYAEAAESSGAPLPYRYRDEMRLSRSMSVLPGGSPR